MALIRDQAGLVPIPENLSKVMVIGPGEDWDLYPALLSALSESGYNAEFFDYPPPWEGAIKNDQLLEELPEQAASKDLVLLFTWQAHLNKLDFQDTWQVELVQRLVESGTPLIVVAIKSPTDILEFPDVSTYIAMYGTTAGSGAGADRCAGRAGCLARGQPITRTPALGELRSREKQRRALLRVQVLLALLMRESTREAFVSQ